MPVTLQTPLNLAALDTAKIVSFKVESNVEQWVEAWVGFGTTVDGVFVEGEVPPAYFKIEKGVNPLAPSQGLCKCPKCDLWYGLEAECLACGGPTVPYDGLARLAPGGIEQVNERKIERFLAHESVPDPSTGKIVPLLATV